MFGFVKSSVKAITGLLSKDEVDIYEFSDNPKLDSELQRLHSEFEMLNKRLNAGAGPRPGGGMSMEEYTALLQREGRGK